jgi:hypothetical protein
MLLGKNLKARFPHVPGESLAADFFPSSRTGVSAPLRDEPRVKFWLSTTQPQSSASKSKAILLGENRMLETEMSRSEEKTSGSPNSYPYLGFSGLWQFTALTSAGSAGYIALTL